MIEGLTAAASPAGSREHAASKTPSHRTGPAPDSHQPGSSSRGGWLWLAVAAALVWPWLLFRFAAGGEQGPPALVALLAGAAILGAAFLLSWAAEAFQLDVSQALALALLSLIAVLPEYAVDVVFAWRAATDPSQAPYAVANMTGANRLLIGLGWSAVVLLAWVRVKRSEVRSPKLGIAGPRTSDLGPRTSVVLERGQAVELAALAAATVYSFLIPLKGGIGILDAVVLFALFGAYAWATARAPAEAPHLVGPAASIGALAPVTRRAVTYALFVYAAVMILLSAEPFAEGLVHSGTALGIDEFLLVQWLAPLASETPEFLVALLFAWRGLAAAGLRTLVASKVNQWTLLIGTLGAAYSLALGRPADLPLDARQTEELLLTSAQSLFALALIANFDLSVREAVFLLGTFLLQLFVPGTEARLVFAAVYLVAGIALLAGSRSRRDSLRQLPALVREAVRRPAPTHAAVTGAAAATGDATGRM